MRYKLRSYDIDRPYTGLDYMQAYLWDPLAMFLVLSMGLTHQQASASDGQTSWSVCWPMAQTTEPLRLKDCQLEST